MTLSLRDYQMDALEHTFKYWECGAGTNPIVVAPTGSGKSLLIAEFCKKVCTESPHVRIIVVAHVKELIAQNEAELKGYWKEANTGIYSAGLGKRNTRAQILFVGIQSIYNKAFDLEKTDIIIVDEAHMIPRNAQTRYGKFLADMKKANPNVVVLGLTATPYRLDSGLLHEGDDAIFDGISYCCDMKSLIAQSFLVPVISKGGVAKIDMTNVHSRAGDYKNDELARAADDPELIKKAVAEIVAYGKDRKAWLVFCAGVEHAEHVKKEIETYGIVCEIVTGETPAGERDAIIKSYREGKTRCIVNVGVLTTGFNAPVCDLIALLMATQSTGKYVQIVGRGMRTFPEKKNCLLLDYGNNVVTHGAIDDVDPVRTRNVFNVVKGITPVKECPNCRAILYAREMKCPACDFEFPTTAPHGTEAFNGSILSGEIKPFFVNVKDIWYSKHQKPGGTPLLKIAMFDELDKEYPIWCCINHTGYAKMKADQIVKQFGGTADNLEHALKESPYWKKPKRIKVIPNGKFFNVVGIEFHPQESTQLHIDGYVQPQLEAPKENVA